MRVVLGWMCGFVYSLKTWILISCLLEVPSLLGRSFSALCWKARRVVYGVCPSITSTSIISLHRFPSSWESMPRRKVLAAGTRRT